MKLTVSKRAGEKKSELTQLRYQGEIPGAIYMKGRECEKVALSGDEFSAVIRELPRGHLPTTIFDLKYQGKAVKAIIKDIQYHPTTYKVLHLDFLMLDDASPVAIQVPVTFVGETECVGVKLGGFVRPVKRHIKVRCFPKDIPSDFKLDIRNLSIGESKRIADIDFGHAVRPLAQSKEIVVVIAKR